MPTAEFTPTVTPYPLTLTEKGAPMALVPAGKFKMGSDAYDNEKPVHTVDLDVFYIDKHEVTNILYSACVQVGACQPPKNNASYIHDSYYGNSEFDQYPVIYVDWNMANTYCTWRGQETGGRTHLPTEAEWEKAARGADGRTYPWGEEIDPTRANYNNNVGDTTAVGSYESDKSPYGVYDMAGNAWEWVADWYDANYYATLGENNANPQGPLQSGIYSYKVLRGGAWFIYINDLRTARRGWHDLAFISNFIGFRCSRSP